LAERIKTIERIASFFRKAEVGGNSSSKFSEDERKAVAGTIGSKYSREKYGLHMKWFGSMEGAWVYKKSVKDNNAHLAASLDMIPLAGSVEKDLFLRFQEEFRKVPGGGVATETRLLAMKRPDVFVCFNSRNQKRLCMNFGIVARGMTFERYWDEIVERIRNSSGRKSSPPSGEKELEAWNARSAFLDAIYYFEPASV